MRGLAPDLDAHFTALERRFPNLGTYFILSDCEKIAVFSPSIEFQAPDKVHFRGRFEEQHKA